MGIINKISEVVKTFIAKTKLGAIVANAISTLIKSEPVSSALLADTKQLVNTSVDKILSCTDIDADVDIECIGTKEVVITITAKCK